MTTTERLLAFCAVGVNVGRGGYTPETRATMVFADDTRVEEDYRGDFRKLWDDINPPIKAAQG